MSLSSSTKPEVQNVQYCKATTGGTATVSMHKNLAEFGRVVFEIAYARTQTDTQTDRHTHHNTLQPSLGGKETSTEVVNRKKISTSKSGTSTVVGLF